MKITSIEINPSGSSEVVRLSFRDPGSVNPFNVKSITGLDADSIMPRYYTGFGNRNFYHLSLQGKDIVFRIGLNPQFDEYKTYSDLRDDLYRMISSSRTGKLDIHFKNDTDIIAGLSGLVSKFENSLFEKAQEVLLTVNCDEPMLKALEPVVIIKRVV